MTELYALIDYTLNDRTQSSLQSTSFEGRNHFRSAVIQRDAPNA